MKTFELLELHIKKVKQYPKGSEGYDPVDMANVEAYLNKLKEQLLYIKKRTSFKGNGTMIMRRMNAVLDSLI